MHRRKAISLLVASSAAPWLSRPAGAQEEAIISVDVEVVNVLATVRDNKGGLVTDLNKDDFILEEDGKRQEIRYFSQQTDLPLTVGLLVDTSVSQERLIPRRAAGGRPILFSGASTQKGSGIPDQLRRQCRIAPGFDRLA